MLVGHDLRPAIILGNLANETQIVIGDADFTIIVKFAKDQMSEKFATT